MLSDMSSWCEILDKLGFNSVIHRSAFVVSPYIFQHGSRALFLQQKHTIVIHPELNKKNTA